MMRHEYTNASLTVRGGAPIAFDGTSRVGYRATLAMPNNTVEFFSKLGRLVRQVLHAVLFPAGPSMLGTLSAIRKQKKAAFDSAPLARGERKPRQSIQGLFG